MPTWNLNHIFEDLAKNFDKIVTEIETLTKDIEAARPQLTEEIDNETFLAILDKKKKLSSTFSKLGGQSYMWHSEDTTDSERTALMSKIDQLGADIGNRLLFFSLWYKDCSKDTAERLEKAAGDDGYYLHTMRKYKPYTLSEKEEQIITMKDVTGAHALVTVFDTLRNKLSFKLRIDGKTLRLNQEELSVYARHQDPRIRKKSYTELLKKYEHYKAPLGEIYRNITLDWYKEGVNIRGHKSSIGVRNFANDIADKAVRSLLNTCKKNVNVFKDYFTLKYQLLKLDKPSRYDLYAPYHGEEKSYSYDEAKKIVLDTFKNFSPKMHKLAKQVIDEEHIHSELSARKMGGAYCYSMSPDVTPYVLLNFTSKERDVSTMAHELGHAIHGLLAQEKHSVLTFHSALPMAETASIFAEMLLTQELLSSSNKKEKISILVNKLDDIYASVGRQAHFVLFEEAAHNAIAEGASVNDLDTLYLKNLRQQFQPALRVPKIFENEWRYIPHIHHTPFYCYAYAWGNLLVLALWKKYEEEGESFKEKYLRLLTHGGSKSPGEILEEVGIDIESEAFWQSGFDVIKELITELREVTDT